jgi:hypothetical protein
MYCLMNLSSFVQTCSNLRMGHPFSKFIPVKSSLPEDIFEKCGKQEEMESFSSPWIPSFFLRRMESIHSSEQQGFHLYFKRWNPLIRQRFCPFPKDGIHIPAWNPYYYIHSNRFNSFSSWRYLWYSSNSSIPPKSSVNNSLFNNVAFFES